MKDLWGQALVDYYHGRREQPLLLNTSFGEPEEVPLDVFFRAPENFEEHELYALDLCQDLVLDIGAGAGCHSLYLQQQGKSVVALEHSPGACEAMRLQGVKSIINQDLYCFEEKGQFGTALLLMNGLGLAGSQENLPEFLNHVMSFLEPGGQLLADSCDVRYLFDGQPSDTDKYYGEITYSYEYRGAEDPSFSWLFIDLASLKQTALQLGLNAQLLYLEDDHYLVRITNSSNS